MAALHSTAQNLVSPMSYIKGVCGATLRKGKGTCHRTAIYSNGRCHHHGGKNIRTKRSLIEIESAVSTILSSLGENPERDGLLRTPERVAKALIELTAGYHQDPVAILGTIFEGDDYNEMVIVKDIPFTSLCEHHLLPFTGKAAMAYIPGNNKIVGLSKLARLLECFARRFQVQERLTTQIAQALHQHPKLQPQGVGIVISSSHSCMQMRGIQRSAETITSCLLGSFQEQHVKNEFMQLIKA
jgi:GTP cyclohydrolase IA